ncbi:MAG TPA: M48 family metalloprotease [Acidimicrobiales bacterium]|nr:M48 family metalloprotease [Acidimicrobiales bacterium]
MTSRLDPTADNERRAALLAVGFVALLAALVTLVGWLLGPDLGWWGLALAVVIGAGLAVLALVSADAIVVRATGAAPIGADEHPRLHNLVDGLCVASGLPRPALGLIDDPALNAFVVGRSPRHATLVVTSGLLDGLTRVELEGVLARQLVLVKHRDSLVATLATTTVAGPLLLAELAGRSPGGVVGTILGLPAALVAPVASRLLDVVLPPRREVLADLAAIDLTRYPPGLIGALEKVRHGAVVDGGLRATAHLWVEPPVAAAGGGPRPVHQAPPIDERIAILREL